MKKKFKYLFAPLAVVLGATLAACGGNQGQTTTPAPTTTAEAEPTTTAPAQTTTEAQVDYDAIIKGLVIDQDSKVVTDDFKLLKSIQGNDITWTSNNENVIKVYEKEGELFAGVLYPTERTVVELTATIQGTHSKKFHVTVNDVDVYSIADNFTLALVNNVLSAGSYDAPQKATISHQSGAQTDAQVFEATVTWASESNLVTIDNVNHKFVVTNSDDRVKAKVVATLTVGNTSTTVPFELTVWHELSNSEKLHVFYDEVGAVSNDMYGYVVAKAGWSDQYNNGYLHVVDATKEGGMYIYRACMTKEVWDQISVGTRIKAAALKSTLYNGLVESSGNIQVSLVTDDETLAPLSADELTALKAGVAVDNLVVSNTKQTKYHTSSIVTLTAWKVKEVGKGTAAAGGDLVTLTKGGVDIKVQLSKYAVDLNSDLANAIVNKNTLNVNDVVNVKGLLNYYNGWCIYAIGDDWTSASANDNDASIADGKAVATFVEENFKDVSFTSNSEKELKATLDGYTLTYSLSGKPKTVKIENGKLVATPTEKAEEATVNVVVKKTINDVEYIVETSFKVTTKLLPENEQIAEDLAKILGDSFPVKTVIDLPATGPVYGTTFTNWQVAEGSLIASIADNKLTVNPTSTATTLTIKVDAVNGETEIKGCESEFVVKYSPSTIAEFLEDNAQTQQMPLELVVAAYNSTNGNAVFVDSTGSIFAYNCGIKDDSKVKVGYKLVVLANLAFNKDMPQLANMKIVEKLAENVDYMTLLGTPETLTFEQVRASLKADGATENAINKAYKGKFIKMTGYVAVDGTNVNFYASLDNDGNGVVGDGCVYSFASADLSLAAYAGKQVVIYAAPRGVNLGYKNFQVQVIKVEFAGDVPASETSFVDVKSLELQLVADQTVTGKVVVKQTPWTTGEITWEVSSSSANATVAAAPNANGEIVVTAVSAGTANITIHPSTGDDIVIAVTVKAAAQPSQGDDEVTSPLEFNVTTFATEKSLTAGTQLDESINLGPVTMSYNKAGNNGKAYESKSGVWEVRFYKGDSGVLTFTVNEGYTVKSITVGYATSNYGDPTDKVLTPVNGVYTISAVTENSNFNIKTITIVFTKA